MLTLLRRIRRSLTESSSMRKYLFYAVGEVALVVIGILLALQINNWNEERKNRKIERSLYMNLLTDLQKDSVDLVRVLRIVNRGINAQRTIIETSYDSLIEKYNIEEIEVFIRGVAAVTTSFFPSYSTYLQISNNGLLPLLKSDDIKNKIVDLYERSYKRYEHVDATIEQIIHFEMHPVISGKLKSFHPAYDLELPDKLDANTFQTHFEELAEQSRSAVVITHSVRRILTDIQKENAALILNIKEELKKDLT